MELVLLGVGGLLFVAWLFVKTRLKREEFPAEESKKVEEVVQAPVAEPAKPKRKPRVVKSTPRTRRKV
jgi:hypothetical protein